MNRRKFLQQASCVFAGLAAAPALGAVAAAPAGYRRAIFTKGLEKLPFEELAAKLGGLGVRAVEAPIRPGGHLEPAEVGDKLPILVAALQKHQIELAIMTTTIAAVDKGGQTEAILRAAAKLGIRRYRLAHLRYSKDQPIARQLANFSAQLKELAALNAELGIQGQYQNHRGSDYLGGPVWDLLELLEGVDPAHLGMAFDFAHATVEGTNTWALNFRRAAPQVAAVYFKDYKIENRTSTAVPLGQGAVDRRAAAMVRELLAPATPVSLHVEYAGSTAELLAGMEKDLATLDGWFGDA